MPSIFFNKKRRRAILLEPSARPHCSLAGRVGYVQSRKRTHRTDVTVHGTGFLPHRGPSRAAINTRSCLTQSSQPIRRTERRNPPTNLVYNRIEARRILLPQRIKVPRPLPLSLPRLDLRFRLILGELEM
jgi:hypothetical protein